MTTTATTTAMTTVAMMTDSLGRSAGWGTAAVVAPAAAAALALAAGWAVQHQPPSPDPAPQQTSPAQHERFQIDHRSVSLTSRALAQQARVTHLERSLRRVRARTAALLKAPLPSGGVGAVGGTTVAASRGRGGGSAPAPPVVAARAPVSHASTGAS